MAAFRLAAMTAARQAETVLLAALPLRLVTLHSVLAMLGALSKTLVGLGGVIAVGMALAIIAARAATLMARAGSAEAASGSVVSAKLRSAETEAAPPLPPPPSRCSVRALPAVAASLLAAPLLLGLAAASAASAAPASLRPLAGAEAKRKERGALTGRSASGLLVVLCSPTGPAQAPLIMR